MLLRRKCQIIYCKLRSKISKGICTIGAISLPILRNSQLPTNKFVGFLTQQDESEWLQWFIFDNSCGSKQMEAGYDGKLNKSENIEDLLKLMSQN